MALGDFSCKPSPLSHFFSKVFRVIRDFRVFNDPKDLSDLNDLTLKKIRPTPVENPVHNPWTTPRRGRGKGVYNAGMGTVAHNLLTLHGIHRLLHHLPTAAH